MKPYTLPLLLSLLLNSPTSWAGGIEQLKAFVAGSDSLQADFTQQVTGQRAANSQQASGHVMIQRPGKFRWTYTKPYDQVIVGDGQKLWLYDKDIEQVTVKKLDQALGSSPAALLAGSNDIEKAYVLKDAGSKDGLDWLDAKPKSSESTFQSVKMGFAKNELVVMELKDNFGQTTVIRFNKLERNPKLSADQFKFVPPKGVDVISE
ncbi:chaperone LolA [Chitinivorax tropicus]|uniref:Outer-membrane lipoprotein carrier protein n=1 Tax=Chitinivorax tropicus TaxID=714531 RepID=A0A840MLE5_9PROT|nr:outer membrane lipoprotein chaperone LolA [Chitinivorax tropicus]MBB5019230.1 chaperone LolA [Chitinivorax tropicus]